MELFASAFCSARCVERSHKSQSFFEAESFLWMTSRRWWKGRRNKEVAEMTKVMKKLNEEVEKKGLKLPVTEHGKEGKSKMIASCGYLEKG